MPAVDVVEDDGFFPAGVGGGREPGRTGGRRDRGLTTRVLWSRSSAGDVELRAAKHSFVLAELGVVEPDGAVDRDAVKDEAMPRARRAREGFAEIPGFETLRSREGFVQAESGIGDFPGLVKRGVNAAGDDRGDALRARIVAGFDEIPDAVEGKSGSASAVNSRAGAKFQRFARNVERPWAGEIVFAFLRVEAVAREGFDDARWSVTGDVWDLRAGRVVEFPLAKRVIGVGVTGVDAAGEAKLADDRFADDRCLCADAQTRRVAERRRIAELLFLRRALAIHEETDIAPIKAHREAMELIVEDTALVPDDAGLGGAMDDAGGEFPLAADFKCPAGDVAGGGIREDAGDEKLARQARLRDDFDGERVLLALALGDIQHAPRGAQRQAGWRADEDAIHGEEGGLHVLLDNCVPVADDMTLMQGPRVCLVRLLARIMFPWPRTTIAPWSLVLPSSMQFSTVLLLPKRSILAEPPRCRPSTTTPVP